MKAKVAGAGLLGTWIKQQGFTQELAGRWLGFTGVAVSQWLSGSRRPNIDSAVQIEERTGGQVSAASWRRPPRRPRPATPVP